MKCLIILTLMLFEQNVFGEPELLLRTARLRISTPNNHHRIQQVQNVLFLDQTIVNGTHLRVTTDQMHILFEGAFRNIELLEVLQIPKCGVQEIRPKAFVNTPSLDKIQLQDNLLTRIENGVFNFMNISQIFLHRNTIFFIHSEAFDNMPHLHTIKLNANRIKTWDSNWFFNTPKLTNVFIRRNSISRLEENSFKNMKKLQVGHEENENSTNIYLSKNRISFIHPLAMSELIRLNNFYIDRNNLTSLPRGLFDQIESISYLNLRRNKIDDISPYTFPKTSKFDTLDLSSNKLECISGKVTMEVKKIILDDNDIGCECMNDLKKNYEGKGKNKNVYLEDCVTGDNDEDAEDVDDEEDDDLADE